MSGKSDIADNEALGSIIASLQQQAEALLSVLVVGGSGAFDGARDEAYGERELLFVADSAALDALADEGRRFDLAIVERFPDQWGDAGQASALIARLRDRHAARVIIVDVDELLSLADYLALGFERWEVEAGSRSFIYDPDSPSRTREWNNSRNWANPDSFDKYRW